MLYIRRRASDQDHERDQDRDRDCEDRRRAAVRDRPSRATREAFRAVPAGADAEIPTKLTIRYL
jgi:hypothetical protein